MKPNAPAKGKGSKKWSGKRPPDNRPCRNCGKAGHWARECYAQRKDNSSSDASPTSPKQGKPGSSSLNIVEEVSDAESDSPFFAYFGAPENWHMDSGANDHMSPFGSDFNSYTTTLSQVLLYCSVMVPLVFWYSARVLLSVGSRLLPTLIAKSSCSTFCMSKASNAASSPWVASTTRGSRRLSSHSRNSPSQRERSVFQDSELATFTPAQWTPTYPSALAR